MVPLGAGTSDASNAPSVFELVGGNYTDGLSAMAANVVLSQSTNQHREIRRPHEQHHELLSSLHVRVDSNDRDSELGNGDP